MGTTVISFDANVRSFFRKVLELLPNDPYFAPGAKRPQGRSEALAKFERAITLILEKEESSLTQTDLQILIGICKGKTLPQGMSFTKPRRENGFTALFRNGNGSPTMVVDDTTKTHLSSLTGILLRLNRQRISENRFTAQSAPANMKATRVW